MSTSINFKAQAQSLIADALLYINPLFNQQNAVKNIYHNSFWAEQLSSFCLEHKTHIVQNTKELHALILSIYFYCVGFYMEHKNSIENSIAILNNFSKKVNLDNDIFEHIQACLMAFLDDKNHTPFSKKFKEIIWIYPLINNFEECMLLKRGELQLVQERIFTTEEYLDFQLQYLLAHKFWELSFLQELFTSKKALLIANLLERKRILLIDIEGKIPKRTKDLFLENPNLSIYEQLEQNSIPNKGLQTFWRTVYPMQVQLSSIADNKANMMISINSIVLTLILASFSIGLANISEISAAYYTIPMICLILTALSSLLIAVLSVLPKFTNTSTSLQKEEKTLKNIIFFGNFVQISAEQYAKEMQKLFENTDVFYNSWSKELYNLGIVLSFKYRLLRISYGIFFIGLMISALSFFIALSI